MPRVRNLTTGRTWDVPAGHYSLTSSEYELVPLDARSPAEEAHEVDAAPVAPAPVRSRARKAPRK